MGVTKAIQRKKAKLEKIARENGLYENFGQKEVSELEDKYINISKYTDEMNNRRMEIQQFNNWCMNYEKP